MCGSSPISTVFPSGRGTTGSVLEHPRLQGRRVVLEHSDVGRGRPIWPGQGIGIERWAWCRAGVPRELLDEPRVGDVFEEQRPDAFAADLPDQSRYRFRRGLAFRVSPLRRQKGDVICLAIISEGVMTGDYLPLVGRDLVQLAAHLPIERLELGFVTAEPLAIRSRVPRVDAGQGSRNVVGIDHAVARVLPGMRIGYRRGFPGLCRRNRLDPFGGRRDDTPKLG